jgi:hypothetical protein
MTVDIQTLLRDAAKRGALVRDLATVVEEEVSSKKGLGGMAIKAAFGLVTGARPGFLKEAIDYLLDGLAEGIRPILDQGRASGLSVGAALQADRSRTASALLAVVDQRASKASNQGLRKAYERLRGSAQKQVEEAVPRLAATLDRHFT